MELGLLGPAWGRTEDYCTVFDTLPLAREMHPGQRNSLDALCKRYDVSNAHRERHGALLDAELLAEVYLAMTGGQATLALDASRKHERLSGGKARPLQRPAQLTVIAPSADDLAAHERALKAVEKASRGACLWMKS
jgi:DNA polymerase-3 subunit epsilon